MSNHNSPVLPMDHTNESELHTSFRGTGDSQCPLRQQMQMTMPDFLIHLETVDQYAECPNASPVRETNQLGERQPEEGHEACPSNGKDKTSNVSRHPRLRQRTIERYRRQWHVYRKVLGAVFVDMFVTSRGQPLRQRTVPITPTEETRFTNRFKRALNKVYNAHRAFTDTIIGNTLFSEKVAAAATLAKQQANLVIETQRLPICIPQDEVPRGLVRLSAHADVFERYEALLRQRRTSGARLRHHASVSAAGRCRGTARAGSARSARATSKQ
uniref:Uncharacterized protein n=1 Tax=Thielaviopsis punctulata TaxID=72032 RepID=A0A2R4ZMR0_9PEZI|nr:TPA_exp: hypothetical protein [Thielaviopsis punctulata]